MKDVRITVMTRAEHHDLIEKYENPIEHACEMEIGKVYCIFPQITLKYSGMFNKNKQERI